MAFIRHSSARRDLLMLFLTSCVHLLTFSASSDLTRAWHSSCASSPSRHVRSSTLLGKLARDLASLAGNDFDSAPDDAVLAVLAADATLEEVLLLLGGG